MSTRSKKLIRSDSSQHNQQNTRTTKTEQILKKDTKVKSKPKRKSKVDLVNAFHSTAKTKAVYQVAASRTEAAQVTRSN